MAIGSFSAWMTLSLSERENQPSHRVQTAVQVLITCSRIGLSSIWRCPDLPLPAQLVILTGSCSDVVRSCPLDVFVLGSFGSDSVKENVGCCL